MTYTALCLLVILGDDLSGVDKPAVVAALKGLQRPDGCFDAATCGAESDMRFVYCACAVSTLLNDWSGVDVDAAVAYIHSCQSFEGPFGLRPGQEAHSGSTYCALASLALMGKLDTELRHRDDIVHWLTARQVAGFQGRPNKLQDSCYSWWVGGALAVLGEARLVSAPHLSAFLVQCQRNKYGGFSKYPRDDFPDILHSYFGLCGLSLLELPGCPVAVVHAPLGLSRQAVAALHTLHGASP